MAPSYFLYLTIEAVLFYSTRMTLDTKTSINLDAE